MLVLIKGLDEVSENYNIDEIIIIIIIINDSIYPEW